MGLRGVSYPTSAAQLLRLSGKPLQHCCHDGRQRCNRRCIPMDADITFCSMSAGDFSPTALLTALTFRCRSSRRGGLVKRLTSVPALLVASTLFGFVAYPLRPAAQEYGDSPRPSPVSRLHMTQSVSEEHLLEKVEPEHFVPQNLLRQGKQLRLA